MFTNGGNLDYKNSDTIDLLPLNVFYNPDYIVNILKLVDVTSKFGVNMYTNK